MTLCQKDTTSLWLNVNWWEFINASDISANWRYYCVYAKRHLANRRSVEKLFYDDFVNRKAPPMKAQNVEPEKELFSNEDDYRAYRDNFRPNGGIQMQKYPRCQPYQTFFFFVTDDEDQ